MYKRFQELSYLFQGVSFISFIIQHFIIGFDWRNATIWCW